MSVCKYCEKTVTTFLTKGTVIMVDTSCSSNTLGDGIPLSVDIKHGLAT